MKPDLALHEIMRIDEYEDEHIQTDLADNSSAKNTESLVATQAPTESATANSDSSISVDIPTDTVINYDEPPTELIDAPAEATVMSDDITPSELANIPVVEEIGNDEISTESAPPTKPAIDLEKPLPEPTDLPTAEASINDETFVKQLESIPANTAGFFEEVISSTTVFLKNNRQLLVNLGIIFLAFIATKLAFAGLSAIDDIPLVSPLLKLVGLFYIARFVWNYLIRERDRQQLVKKFNSMKAQVLGDRS
jgi:hypothetical protein